MLSILRDKLNSTDAYYHYKWLLSATLKYGTEVVKLPQTNKLRLILGVGRSGTTWISQTLSRTTTPVRILGEPLFHFSPKLKFSNTNDHTAISYYAQISMLNRLEMAYRLLSSTKIEYSKYFSSKFLVRDDKNFKYILIKEVHSLLQTEFLVDRLKCPTILLCRNPLYVVDSLLDAQSLSTTYLKNEFNYILDQSLYELYFQDEKIRLKQCASKINALHESREKIILEKVFAIWIINCIFRKIGSTRDYVKVIDYEQVCINPDAYFLEMSNFLDFEYQVGSFNFSTTKTTVSSPYSVNRNTEVQIERDFRFLSSGDTSYINNFFEGFSITL